LVDNISSDHEINRVAREFSTPTGSDIVFPYHVDSRLLPTPKQRKLFPGALRCQRIRDRFGTLGECGFIIHLLHGPHVLGDGRIQLFHRSAARFAPAQLVAVGRPLVF
jgi:hypothetical protein